MVPVVYKQRAYPSMSLISDPAVDVRCLILPDHFFLLLHKINSHTVYFHPALRKVKTDIVIRTKDTPQRLFQINPAAFGSIDRDGFRQHSVHKNIVFGATIYTSFWFLTMAP